MSRILVTRAFLPSLDEYVREIGDIWETHWLTNMGAKHEQLRQALCDYLGVPEAELFTNGHMALEMSLQAMDLKGEVITTPFTFASTTHAIVRCGCRPVFCDIDPEAYVGFLVADGILDLADYALKHGMNAVHPALYLLQDMDFVMDCHKKGLDINVWTVNEPEHLAMAGQLHVTTVITNYPDRAKKILEG